jgi:hypothetical protein
MINLVEYKITTNEANDHQGAPLLDHPLEYVSNSMKDDPLKRKEIV